MILKTQFYFWLVIIFTGLTQSSGAQEFISDDDFFAYEHYGEFHLSPDGRRIAVSDFRGEERKLLLYDVDNNLKETHLKIDTDGTFVLWATWATNTRLLVRVLTTTDMKLPRGVYAMYDGKRSKSLVGVPVARMMAIDIDGSNPVMFFEDAGKKIQQNFSHANISSVLPQDPDHVLIPLWDGKMNLYKVNIHTGEYERIERGKSNTNGWDITPQGDIVARYDAADNGRYVKIYTRAPGDTKWDRLAKVREEDLESFSPVAPGSSPKTYYVSARPEGHDRLGVFEYNLEEKTFLRPISTHPVVDLHGAVTDANGKYIGAAYIEDRVTYDFIDKTLEKHIAVIEAHFNDERNITIENISTDGNRWLILAMGPRHPGSYYLYEAASSKVSLVAETNKTLKPNGLGRTERVSFKSRDGLDLFGYLTKPPNLGQSIPPLIVMPHGGPEARDYMQFDPMVQYFVNRGYQVFQPHFRGSAGFGQTFAQSGYREWAGLMLDDIDDGVEHLTRTGVANKNNMCIAGMSYGGYAALMSSLKAPEKYKCVVSINGVTDLEAMLNYSKDRYGKKSDVYNYHIKTIGDPKENIADIRENSPITHVDKFMVPVLLIHGRRDTIVPFQQSRDMAAALRKVDKDRRYVLVPNTDHNLMGVSGYAKATGISSMDDNAYGFKVALAEMRVFFQEHLELDTGNE